MMYAYLHVTQKHEQHAMLEFEVELDRLADTLVDVAQMCDQALLQEFGAVDRDRQWSINRPLA